MNALIPVLVAVAGVLAYALASNAKVAEIGRLLFFAGVLALMFAFAGRAVHLF